MRLCFPVPQCLRPEFLLSKFSPRFLAKFSCQIGEALAGLVQKSDNTQPLHPKEIWDLKMVPRIAFHKEFSHLPGGLGHFAESNSIPQIQPTIFHPSLIATKQQTFLLSLCVPLFPHCHSSRIDEVVEVR